MRKKNTSVALESLEGRRLLSGGEVPFDAPIGPPVTYRAGVSYDVTSKGTLVVHGTDAADTITFSYGEGKIILNGTDGTFTTTEGFWHTRIKRILVEANGGDDKVLIPNNILNRRPATLVGGEGNDTLVGTAGNVLIGGGGNDKLHLQPLMPSVEAANAVLPAMVSPNGPGVLSGGAGRDTLVADSSDSVIGGSGEDVVIQHIYYGVDEGDNTLPHLADDTSAYARSQFGERASGIELFGSTSNCSSRSSCTWRNPRALARTNIARTMSARWMK